MLLVHSESCREKILNRWYMSIVRIFYESLKNKKAKNKEVRQRHNKNVASETIPIIQRVPDGLFRSTSVLLYPIEELQPELNGVDVKAHAPRFVVRLWLKEEGIDYDPSFADIEEAIIEGLEYVLKTVESVPKIEDVLPLPLTEKLLQNEKKQTRFRVEVDTDLQNEEVLVKSSEEYVADIEITSGRSPVELLKNVLCKIKDDSGSSIQDLKIVIDPEIVNSASKNLKQYSNTCFEVCKKFMHRYNHYIANMYGKTVEDEIENFFIKEHSFEEYTV
ncbi:hypothetical protein HK096_011252, partial [Nowakowskiella sp. JEL0078]